MPVCDAVSQVQFSQGMAGRAYERIDAIRSRQSPTPTAAGVGLQEAVQ
jgi:hypothetical protein